MNLARFPRRRYSTGPSPLEFLPRLTQSLGGPDIYMKRDDLLGLAGGGNKTRKLEFLVADALAQGADTLITCGAIQSNHCRLTLAYAVKEGLKCWLVLGEREPGSYDPHASGNNFLYYLLGVEGIKVVPGDADMLAEMQTVADELAAKGRKAYVIPVGGSNAIGATGYVACAEEILGQAFDQGLNFDAIITSSGSAGTHAGLVTGFAGTNANIPVIGINVGNKKEPEEDLVYTLIEQTAERLGVRQTIPRSAVTCYEEYVGPAYAVPTPEMVEAVELVARTESILLDPVYTGKAMAGLIALVRQGIFTKGQKVLFVHTGGWPALFSYTDTFFNALPK